MNVRTRIAPSPTGYFHLGNLRVSLTNYALAKQNNGQFIWRNEDTDRTRFIEDAMEFNMKWAREFGLDWDEGPDKGGPYAPYTQTERIELYKKAYEELIDKDYAYRCFCTPERLKELREMQTMTKQQTKYDGFCRHLSKEEIDKNLSESKPFTVRLKVPKDRKISFDDVITHNHVVWDSNEIDDYILVKSNGIPTYHLAVVVDDVAMKITHAFRGSEWLSTTPVHMLVYEGLGIKEEERPKIGHFTVILDPTTPGKKFSKRNKAFKINGLVLNGYLKEAILNYLMLLGWAPKDNRELFTLEEFVKEYDLAGMQKSNPNWDQKKMDWFNGHYSRALSLEDYTNAYKEWVNKYLLTSSQEDIEAALVNDLMPEERALQYIELAKKTLEDTELQSKLTLVQERAVNFWEVLQQIEFFYKKPENIDWNIKQLNKIQDKVPEIKSKIHEMLADLTEFTQEPWEAGMRKIAEETDSKAGDVFMVLRVAVVGGPFSPPLLESLQLLGKDEVLSRI